MLLTTGPLFLTGLYRRKARDVEARLLTLDEHGHGTLRRSYVRHIRGRSWGEWDTHLFSFCFEHWRPLVSGRPRRGPWL